MNGHRGRRAAFSIVIKPAGAAEAVIIPGVDRVIAHHLRRQSATLGTLNQPDKSVIFIQLSAMKSQSRLHSSIHPLYATHSIAISLALLGGLNSSALAQSISIDGSTPTQLNGSNNCSGNCDITGGLRDGNGSGPNLFHSFGRFNIDTGAVVTFEDPGVDNIFGRVTGSELSNIDGTLKVDGTANLFLLNPNGIVFGNNARLDIQGSFLSSTAESLLFENGAQFSTADSSVPSSILTISAPVGLQFGTSVSPITVQGEGHNLTYNRNFTISRNTPTTGLTNTNERTIALLGGDVTFRGGNISSEAGHIEIAGLGDDAFVKISETSSGWDFDYSETNNFSNIQLLDRASLDASGSDAGSVRVQGKRIEASGGSAILAQVLGSGSGQIDLNASESLSFVGVNLSAIERMPTGAYIEIAPGANGNGNSQIVVQSSSINLEAGAQIGLGMAGTGTSGSVDIAAQSITADNGSNATPSSIFTGVLPIFGPPPGATGDAGDLNIDTEQLVLTNGAQLIANTFGAGNAGNINIDAQNIEVSGFNAGGASGIFSLSEVPIIPPLPNGSGEGGELTIRTERLTVTDGGQISVGTNGGNSAGNIRIEASETVKLTGGSENGRSGIFASALTGARASAPGSGSGGDIQIQTGQLSLLEGATINASNFASVASGKDPGTGPAGNIDISAESIAVKDGSLITTDTVPGDRANINLRSNSLVLRRAGNITTNATGSATGGNININTEALIAFENSDITANAVDNFGGRVVVNAATILGTAYRDQLTAESDITASSALGPAFSGSVELNSPEVDPANGLTELPEGLASDNQVVAACEQMGSNTFVATGRGGLPEDASQLITGQTVWNDFRLLEATNAESDSAQAKSNTDRGTAETASVPTPTIVEARAWSIDSDGQVVLGMQATAPSTHQLIAKCLTQG